MTDLSRRDFLKIMGLGTASALALAGCGSTETADSGSASTGESNASAADTTAIAQGTDLSEAETVTGNATETTGTMNGNVTMGPDAAQRTLVAVGSKTFETLDPFYATGAIAQRMRTILWTSLWDVEYGGAEDIGIGVKEWSFSDDGMTVDFTIYDNIYDTNGNNITADDILFYCDYYTGTVGKKLSNMTSIEKTGDYSIKMGLKLKYYPGYLGTANGLPNVLLSQASYEAAGEDGFRSNPITTGPYKAVDFMSGSYAVFEQTYNYWGDITAAPHHCQPNVDFVRFDVISEESQIATALRTNTIQAYDIKVSTAEDFVADPGNVVVHKYPALYPSFLMFNMYPGSIFADNKALREAIAYGINWDDVAYAATMGYGNSTGVIGHDALAGYNKDWETDGSAIKYDKELAAQKLEEAGYKPGELTIKFTYNQTPDDFAVMQENLSEIGITLEMDLVDEVTYNTIRGQANTLSWQILGSDQVPKGFVTNILYTYCETSSYDWGQVCGANDPEMNELAIAARYGTQEDIDACYHALMERLWVIPRYNGNAFIGSYNKIEQVTVNSSQELMGQACLFADDYDVFY